MKTLKLWYWKWRLKKAYLSWVQSDYSCGSTLTGYLSGDTARLNYCIRKVNELDPTAQLKEKP